MISTHRDGARVGTISSPVEYYLEWKDPYPLESKDLGESPTAQQLLIQGLLTPKNFLDIVENFTIYEPDSGRLIKKIARYQQFRAVRRKRLSASRHQGIARAKVESSGIPRGSGKSLTMVFLTQKIRQRSSAAGLQTRLPD